MFYEDFRVNHLMTTGHRTVSEVDLDDFIRLSGLDNPIFTSAAAAGTLGRRDRLVPAPLQLSLAMGLSQQAGIFDRVVAVIEFRELKFLKPVHPGDTLTVEAAAVDKKPVSNPERGIVWLEYKMKNQDGSVVMTAQAVYMMKRRPSKDD